MAASFVDFRIPQDNAFIPYPGLPKSRGAQPLALEEIDAARVEGVAARRVLRVSISLHPHALLGRLYLTVL